MHHAVGISQHKNLCFLTASSIELVDDSALELTEVGDAEFRDVAVSSVPPSLTTLVVVAAVVEKLLDDGVVALAVVSHPLHVLSHLSPTLTHKPLAKIL